MSKYYIQYFTILSLFAVLTLVACSKNEKVLLALKYDSLEHYALTYNTGSKFIWKDSVADFSTTLNGELSVSENNSDTGSIEIKTDSILIVSSILDSSRICHLKKCYEKKSFKIPTVNGISSADIDPLDTILGSEKTELYKKLTKLIPALPSDSVSEGFAWERTFSVPFATALGQNKSTVYQSYSFDSLTDNNSLAFVSWKFRYSVANPTSEDTLSLLNSIPNYGNGRGWSVVNVKKGFIVSSKIEFETPVCKMKNFSVKWHENALLTMVN